MSELKTTYKKLMNLLKYLNNKSDRFEKKKLKTQKK
ncbi:hypothetical protein P700755_003312 [Psychroflexus torquis ATCC 700755]|uniref:Uncharacterized protein n=1 Tax=Psychroflexus torquis (strain ATCC 700755 / CIP 106069 / ACAM 623) TaxID=313595 RepID=K4IHX7_PSYTT|nr:hypothetical protein P700755_003312 [Psychroflexus torquis ATCC 700755]